MADTPFGLSFGNPAKYMGQSPLAEAGKALKTGAVLWGLQQTGAISALDKLGVKPNQAGGFSYSNPTAPTGSVPPMASAAPVSPVVPSVSEGQPIGSPVNSSLPSPLQSWKNSGWNPEMKSLGTQLLISAGADFSDRPQNEGYRPYNDTVFTPKSTTPPPTIGVDILDGKYHGAEHSYLEPQYNPMQGMVGGMFG